MNNKEKAELKPIYIQEVIPDSSNEEISLIDLTLILIKHKILLGLVFIICTTIGIGGYLLTVSPAKTIYSYSTLVKIGHSINDNKVTLLETPETLLAKIRINFIPEILENSNNNYVITANNPEQTELVILKISSDSENDSNAIKLLNNLVKRIEQDHHQTYLLIKNSLELNLKSKDHASYAYILSNLQQTLAVSTPIKSNVTVASSIKPKVILVVSLFVGLFLGVFAAFFAEFVQKVKEKQKETAKVDA